MNECGLLYRADCLKYIAIQVVDKKKKKKVFTLERSEGVETLVVERHRPPYDGQKDSTIIELERELIRQEICGARGRRATGAAFDSTMTTMDQQEGLLDMLKGQQQLPGL